MITENLFLQDQHNGGDSPTLDSPPENEKDDFDSDYIDSKTLKYKYQSAQNELKKKIEMLESILESNKIKMIDLEKCLNIETQANVSEKEENVRIKEELQVLQQKFKESCNESQQLKDKVTCLIRELEVVKNQEDQHKSIISASSDSYEQLVSLEEELVLLKQRYAQINEEKVKLLHDLSKLKEQYHKVCNTSYDKMYFYIAPLILMILYLVISAMIS